MKPDELLIEMMEETKKAYQRHLEKNNLGWSKACVELEEMLTQVYLLLERK